MVDYRICAISPAFSSFNYFKKGGSKLASSPPPICTYTYAVNRNTFHVSGRNLTWYVQTCHGVTDDWDEPVGPVGLETDGQ